MLNDGVFIHVYIGSNLWGIFSPRYLLGCDAQKGMIHRLSTALKNVWAMVVEQNRFMVVCQCFVTEAINKVNKKDFRIAMNPYLKAENNIRFWSKCLSWTYVWWNLDFIEAWFQQQTKESAAYNLWNRHHKECKFLMVTWIYIMEVYIYSHIHLIYGDLH